MKRSSSPEKTNNPGDLPCPAPQADTTLLHIVMLVACLIPALIAFSTALADEQPAAAASTPARVERVRIEPAASPGSPVPTSAPNRPARLSLPFEEARPIPSGRRLPNPPAAAEFDAALIGSFTSTIQPLLLNRCAAGKCHGVNTADTDTAAPQLQRQSIRGTVSREMTLTNIEALTVSLRPDFDTRRLLGPAGSPHGGARLPPLSPQQLQRLAAWLDAALAQRITWSQVEQASFETTVPAAPQAVQPSAEAASPATNRFQKMLEDAANPQPLPPPQEPPGIIPLDDLPEAQPQAD